MHQVGDAKGPDCQGCRSPTIAPPRDLELAIGHDATVLITALPTQRAEQIARVIHARSRRVRLPFVTVDCHELGGDAADAIWRRAG
jgi:transcriptional regulator of acetoin/glycerol metabolism